VKSHSDILKKLRSAGRNVECKSFGISYLPILLPTVSHSYLATTPQS